MKQFYIHILVNYFYIIKIKGSSNGVMRIHPGTFWYFTFNLILPLKMR